MKKEYGWVDYTNLALNVAQTVQLETVRRQLSQLQQIQLDDKARAQLLDQIRQWVFETEQALKDIMSLAEMADKEPPDRADKARMAVYMYSSVLRDNFEKTGVSPATFPDFDDKDRVQNIMSEIDDVINQSYERLEIPSRKEVDECRHFIEEEPHLNKLIECLKRLKENNIDPSRARSELVRKEALLKEKTMVHGQLEFAAKSATDEAVTKFEKKLTIFLLPVFLVVGIGVIVIGITEYGIESISDFLTIILGVPFILFIWYVLTGGVVLFIYKAVNGRKVAEINIKSQFPDIHREDLSEHIATLEDRCNKLRISLGEVEILYEQFGKLSEAEAVALQTERQERVAKAHGVTTNKN